jgi:hypothetical protein
MKFSVFLIHIFPDVLLMDTLIFEMCGHIPLAFIIDISLKTAAVAEVVNSL